ncbi:TRAP transporter substrate-binding protein DctP [bacterium]|nr:TRAP transporter substrate-binding protein DctP [candidate division CSSED10-310 bacterium]
MICKNMTIGIGMALTILSTAPPVSTNDITLKIATIAPDGSPWIKEFQKMAEEVRDLTGGQVKFKIYPGGILGDDDVVIRKIRVGQLDGAMLTGGGLSSIYDGFRAFALPRMFFDIVEVDHALQKLRPDLATEFRKAGYEPLGFAGIGFTYMFTRQPMPNASALKKAKAWLLENDPVMKAIYQVAGVTPVSVGIGDVMTALQTGLLDCVFNTPSGVLALQWFTKVNIMTDIPLTYSIGGFLVSSKSWNKIPEGNQRIVQERVSTHLEQITANGRKEDERALSIISQRGVEIQKPTPELRMDFERISKSVRLSLVGPYVPPESFNRLQDILAVFRTDQSNN